MPHFSDDFEIPFYHVQCDCGNTLQVTAAQAGELLPCTACGKLVLIPTLSFLQKQPPAGYLPRTGRKLRRYQFDLAELMTFVTVCALILSAAKTIEYYFMDSWLGPILYFALLASVTVLPPVFVIFVQRISWLFWGIVRRIKREREP